MSFFSFVPQEPSTRSGWFFCPCPCATRDLATVVFSSWLYSPYPPVSSSPLYFCLWFCHATTHAELSLATYDAPPLVFSCSPLSLAKGRKHRSSEWIIGKGFGAFQSPLWFSTAPVNSQILPWGQATSQSSSHWLSVSFSLHSKISNTYESQDDPRKRSPCEYLLIHFNRCHTRRRT